MKRLTTKILFIFALALVLLLGALPALAATCSGLVPCGCSGGPACSWNDLYVLINKVITFLIFTLGIPLAVLIIVVSGIQLVLNPSSAEAKTVWKDRIRKGLMGLLIIMCAYLLVKVVVWGVTAGRDNYQLQSQVKQ